MSKKSKLNDDMHSQVILDGYKGHEEVPKNVTHVRFHPSVVKVSVCVFDEHTELIEVILNEGLLCIDYCAFRNCTALQSITIPSTIKELGDYAFTGCSKLRKVVLSEGLEKIGVSVFQQCETLQRITIPSTVDYIGEFAFQNCLSLQSITIPSTVTEIDEYSFSYCRNLREVVLKEGTKTIKSYAFVGCSLLERITIPLTVIEIKEHAFKDCSGLREVVIEHHEGVQIRDDSFTGCRSLERFKFPSLLTRLDDIIQAGQRNIETKMDDIPTVEWRDGELSIPSIRQQIVDPWGIVYIIAEVDEEKLTKVEGLIRYYEIKEATTLFELALWKARIDRAEGGSVHRNAHRIEVPGPVKDAILQFLNEKQ